MAITAGASEVASALVSAGNSEQPAPRTTTSTKSANQLFGLDMDGTTRPKKSTAAPLASRLLPSLLRNRRVGYLDR